MSTSPTGTNLLARVARIATLIAGVALIGMAATEGWQVFARYVLNDSPGWTEPVALFLLATAMSLGAAACVRSGSHFGFFILAHNAPPALRRGMEIFAGLVVAAIGAALAIWGTQLLFDGIDVPAAGTLLPESARFLPIAIAGALICVFALERLIAPPPAVATVEG